MAWEFMLENSQKQPVFECILLFNQGGGGSGYVNDFI
jgi:hypothetical protein